MNLIPRAVRDVWGTVAAWMGGAAVRAGIPPLVLVAAGLAAMLGGAVVFANGAVRWGGGLVLVGRLCDAVAGHAARQAGRVTPRLALLDSTLDRAGEAALFAGLAVHFLRGGAPADWQTGAVLLAVLGLATSVLAAYARQRAEGLGLETPAGGGRADRLVVLGIVPLGFGAGPEGRWLLWLVAAVAVLGAISLLARLVSARPLDHAPGLRRRDTLAGRGSILKKPN